MKHRISPAVAISLVALFLSLTGAGFAASRYIITSTHQIKPSVLHKLQGARGPQGAAGPQGVPGAVGQTASVSQPFFYVRHSNTDTLDPSTHTVTTLYAYCDPGDRPLSGGYDGQGVTVTTDRPLSANPVAPWAVSAHLEQGAANGTLTDWVLCERS